MGESTNLRRDAAHCPSGCTCSPLEAKEGVDRLLRTVFAMPTFQPSWLLRQRLRQRIAYEDSLWRPLERLSRSDQDGSSHFFTLPPGSTRRQA